jgi:hypothetical protein
MIKYTLEDRADDAANYAKVHKPMPFMHDKHLNIIADQAARIKELEKIVDIWRLGGDDEYKHLDRVGL